ncbi:MAG TPA: serine/threonine-protein kinase [Gemmatimonadales bacterium]|nr:serine/threonine-protein kinase [Gemmatimonadales bacterium]
MPVQPTSDPFSATHPAAFGPYRITGVLGQGGMGTVYAAEQVQPIRRRVALKVIRGGLDSANVVARFEAERQALAVMEHPSIARVFDAGTSDGGSLYFVMEYVEGTTLGRYCDARDLSVRQRLELFIPICLAVQHAHQKGVIHRDLKPSNVLVTEQAGVPLPKVIDFGIAKAVNRRLAEDSLVTQVGTVLGTPAYMSPEQAQGSGVDVDTRTDVYSLGVMLYEILAGTLPVDPAEIGLVQFVARLLARNSAPEPPSRRVTRQLPERTVVTRSKSEQTALVRELRGDLDAIVLKAMAPERERRYQTAQELAQDIERHLRHEPIAARAPSVSYRFGKFVQRHPTGVALAATVVLFLAGLAAEMTVQARRIAQARTVAEQRRTQAEDLISYMVGDLRAKLEPIGKLAILDDVGRRALAYFAAVPATELNQDELFRRSQALSQLGQVRVAQGDLEQAMPAFRESLTLAADLAARNPSKAEWQVGLGAGHFWVGYTYFLRGALDSALAEFEPYLGIAQRLVERDSARPEWQLELGYAHSNIGSVREAQGDLPGALEAYRYTLAVKQRLVALDTANVDWQVDLGVTHNTVGRAYERLGQLDSAEHHYWADLEIRERVAARDTSNALWRERLVPALTYAGGIDQLRGRLGAARARRDSAYRVARTLGLRDPDNADWARNLGVTALLLGRTEVELGARAAGIGLLQESRRTLRRLVERDSTNADLRLQLGIAESELAGALAAGGEAARARAGVTAAESLLAPMAGKAGAERRARLALARARLVAAELDDRQHLRDSARTARLAALDALGDPAGDELEGVDVRARALVGLGRPAEAEPLVARLRGYGYRAPGFPELAAKLNQGS